MSEPASTFPCGCKRVPGANDHHHATVTVSAWVEFIRDPVEKRWPGFFSSTEEDSVIFRDGVMEACRFLRFHLKNVKFIFNDLARYKALLIEKEARLDSGETFLSGVRHDLMAANARHQDQEANFREHFHQCELLVNYAVDRFGQHARMDEYIALNEAYLKKLDIGLRQMRRFNQALMLCENMRTIMNNKAYLEIEKLEPLLEKIRKLNKNVPQHYMDKVNESIKDLPETKECIKLMVSFPGVSSVVKKTPTRQNPTVSHKKTTPGGKQDTVEKQIRDKQGASSSSTDQTQTQPEPHTDKWRIPPEQLPALQKLFAPELAAAAKRPVGKQQAPASGQAQPTTAVTTATATAEPAAATINKQTPTSQQQAAAVADGKEPPAATKKPEVVAVKTRIGAGLGQVKQFFGNPFGGNAEKK